MAGVRLHVLCALVPLIGAATIGAAQSAPSSPKAYCNVGATNCINLGERTLYSLSDLDSAAGLGSLGSIQLYTDVYNGSRPVAEGRRNALAYVDASPIVIEASTPQPGTQRSSPPQRTSVRTRSRNLGSTGLPVIAVGVDAVVEQVAMSGSGCSQAFPTGIYPSSTVVASGNAPSSVVEANTPLRRTRQSRLVRNDPTQAVAQVARASTAAVQSAPTQTSRQLTPSRSSADRSAGNISGRSRRSLPVVAPTVAAAPALPAPLVQDCPTVPTYSAGLESDATAEPFEIIAIDAEMQYTSSLVPVAGLTPTLIPEPGTLAFFGAALLGMFGFFRRIRSRSRLRLGQ